MLGFVSSVGLSSSVLSEEDSFWAAQTSSMTVLWESAWTHCTPAAIPWSEIIFHLGISAVLLLTWVPPRSSMGVPGTEITLTCKMPKQDIFNFHEPKEREFQYVIQQWLPNSERLQPTNQITLAETLHTWLSLSCAGVRASPALLTTWSLQKYFSHPSLAIYFFPIPPIKLKLGVQIGGRLLIANHYNLPIRNRGQQSDHICYTLLWQVLGFVVTFTSLRKLCKNVGPKPFC